MAKEPKKLDDLFLESLKDIYFAEKKILGALPKMAKAAQSQELAAAFEKHLAETEDQVERLEKVFGMIEEDPKGKVCPAIVGIVEEGQEIMKDFGFTSWTRPARYRSSGGALRSHTAHCALGLRNRMMQPICSPDPGGKNTDAALSKLAESVINQQAEAA